MKRCLLLLSLLLSASFTLMAQCPAGQWAVEVQIIADNYPNETTWNLYVNNDEVAAGAINNETVCADTTACVQFLIQDSYGDGICCGYGQGSYTVVIDGEVAVTGGEFTSAASHSINCAEGTVCENPFYITEGDYIAQQENSYYAFTPDSTGNYAISTCGLTACDTYLWVYTNCTGIDISGGNSGALYYNNDGELCGSQSNIEALLSAGNTYIIRVGLNDEATCGDGIPFSVAYQSPMTSVLPIVKLTTVGDPINNDVKVPVDMKIIDNGPGELNALNETDLAYEGLILAELQGFTGPFYPKKNYDFDLIDELGNKIDTSLLGMPSENDWIFKAEYLDNNLLVNTVAYEFARRMGRYAPRTRLCELFLDGQYIGVYTLTEKVKRDENRVDIAKLTPTDISGIDLTGGYIIEMNINGAPGSWNSAFPPINEATNDNPVEFKYVYPKASEIMPQQAEYIKDYVDSFEIALDDDTYLDAELGYRNWIDVSTFIDFLIVNEFTMNFDSYGRSTYMYKEKDTDGGKLCIGPVWDYDRAMASDPTAGWVWEITHLGWPFPFWWSKMYTDEAYTHELACRWKSLRADVFTTENFHSFIDSLAEPLNSGPAQRNFALWQTLNPDAYPEQILNMKNWLSQRLNWMDEALDSFSAELPAVDIPESISGCAGLTYEAPLNPTWNYNWIPGPETAEIVFQSEGEYQLRISDDFGCYTDHFLFADLSLPDATFTIEAEPNGYEFGFIGQNGTNSNYSWSFGDGTFDQNGIQVNHNYAMIGNYTVTLTVVDSVGCTAQSTQEIVSTAITVDEFSNHFPWQIYPIPANDYLVIEFPDVRTNSRYSATILNALGQELYRIPLIQEKTTMNIGNLISGGIYRVQIYNDEEKIIGSRAIVKE
jgi:hypothetical protein